MKAALAITALTLSVCGCGAYSFTGQGISGIKSIAVEPFENRTSEFGIRDRITDALIDKLLSDRTLSIANVNTADAILKGAIVSVDDRPLTFNAAEEVSENQVVITIEVMLVRPGLVEPIWQTRLTGDGSYPYRTGSPEERDVGMKVAVDRLVQDLVNKLTSDW